MRWIPRALPLLWIAGALALTSAPTIGQETTATLFGLVTDADTGLPLPAANITVAGTVIGTMTGLDGTYRLPGLPAGPHRVIFSVVGYRAEERVVELTRGEQLRLDAALQTIPLALPDIVVTAGRQEQRAERASASVGVLSGDEVAGRAVTRIDRVLPLVPGVTMVEDQIGIRGSTGYTKGAAGRVLVLMDGVPAIGGDTGNVRWDTLPAEVIERVEVVKGPASSLYGSSAMGGVVNVITRSAHQGPRLSARLRMGRWERPYHAEYSFDGDGGLTRGGDLTLSRTVGGLGLLLSGGYESSDGFRQNGWYRSGHLLMKLEGPSGGRDRWSVVADAVRHEYGNFIEWDGPNDPYEVSPLVSGDWVRSDKMLVTGTWRRLAGPAAYLQVQPHLNAVRWRNYFRDNNDHATALRGALDVQLVAASAIGTLTAGGMGAMTGVDATSYGERTVWEGALFIQNETELGERTRVSVGARLDRSDTDLTEADLVLSPRAALVHEATDRVTLRLMGGGGFRAPSVAERFIATSTSGFTVVPNLGLEPETAWSVELTGVWQPLPLLWLEGGLFLSRYASMIEPERISDGNIQFRNLTRARIQGAEITVRAAAPDGRVRLQWSHLWLSARDLDRHIPLAYRRPSQGSALVEFRDGPWRLSADLLYGERIERVGIYPYDRRIPLRRLDGRFAVEALGAVWTLHGRNLTEYAYTEIERNLSPPREWMISVERHW